MAHDNKKLLQPLLLKPKNTRDHGNDPNPVSMVFEYNATQNKKHLRPTYMLSHYKHSRDSDKRDAKTKAPAAYIMSFTCSHIDQHSCDSDEKAPDRHKTKDLTTTATPAAATRPTTSEQYFVHATGARPHQLNADTPIFDASRTDQVMTSPDPRSLCVSQCMRHGRIRQPMILFVGASYCGQESDVRSHAYI